MWEMWTLMPSVWSFLKEKKMGVRQNLTVVSMFYKMDCSLPAMLFLKQELRQLLFWKPGPQVLGSVELHSAWALWSVHNGNRWTLLSRQAHNALVTSVCKMSLVAIANFFGLHYALEDIFGRNK